MSKLRDLIEVHITPGFQKQAKEQVLDPVGKFVVRGLIQLAKTGGEFVVTQAPVAGRAIVQAFTAIGTATGRAQRARFQPGISQDFGVEITAMNTPLVGGPNAIVIRDTPAVRGAVRDVMHRFRLAGGIVTDCDCRRPRTAECRRQCA